MNECNFAYIKYDATKTPFEWGVEHGKQFKDAIHELAEIRKQLMFDKNSTIVGEVRDRLAMEQWNATKDLCPDLHEELRGISEGAEISITDLIILNNYTDFRDIHLPDEGCTVAGVSHGGDIVAGQTWDMHESAKRFVCSIHIPKTKNAPEMVVFSLVGCLGMMGFNSKAQFVGVNNINTDGAETGVAWPALIRHCLRFDNIDSIREELYKAKVTSGHNYIIADENLVECHEISPPAKGKAGETSSKEDGYVFHTNHCLVEDVIKVETPTALNSTTHIRFDLADRIIKDVTDAASMKAMFQNHENEPKSLCSHFQSGTQDPSMTCGGGLIDFKNKKIEMWRGCPVYDKNYKEVGFSFSDEGFIKE